ncbi:phosphatidylglycerophosphatase A [candidate division KSB3 bacterium]|uniref:Phosphatidylglycerophosphatase A n=1 Tax=candidate division KSB3 bacterium TaxID=2044937 RepID=A0A2G6EAU6_9BACT|nr:MAG: phosphatidylglycerophosphatase A [candidate division KSB3 bacterium]PIE30952.1 MAG: phosphatidylglycerophosphatase A [candidate division KSB3 bacterium]
MNTIETLAKKIGWFQLILSTGFLSGYSPIASGTAGTVAAIPLYLILLKLGWIPYLLISALLFGLGIQGANRIEQATGQQDHGIIVIDEIIGYFLTMAFLPQSGLFIILGFFVFRIFDILKPYPIRQIDLNPNLKGFGVMADDALAGVYGNIVLQIIAALIR